MCIFIDASGLPAPFHGQGQYSHQIGMSLTPGITPNNSGRLTWIMICLLKVKICIVLPYPHVYSETCDC